jgi:hypothetical protein
MSRSEGKESYKIVAVGGTGQMVLHYYLQLYLLGVIKDPFDTVVVDTDAINPSIEAVQKFLRELQYGSEPSDALGQTKIPVIETIRTKSTGGDTALELLTGQKIWNDPEPHPAHAFFNKDTLRQSLKQGLFALPALSSLLSQEVLRDKMLRPISNSTIVIVGSVTGGTGGGLTAPLFDAIRLFAKRETIAKTKIRAVLFGDYFRPDEGNIKEDVIRFQSNQTMVLRSFSEAEASEEMHSYHIVGGPGVKAEITRKPNREKGKNIPWPEGDSNPFWQGAQAVEYLLKDTAMQKMAEFEDREVPKFRPPFSLDYAQQRLRMALQIGKMLIKKKAVIRLCHDPWARWIWGEGMMDIAAHFWHIAAVKEGGRARVKAFPYDLQRALKKVWEGEAEEFGLQDVFPTASKSGTVRPGDIARIGWPEVGEGIWDEGLFDDTEKVARRAAATLLFWILREGV